MVVIFGRGTGEARDLGVVFENYDLGEVPIVDGLADFGRPGAAWFKDSDSNTYELSEVM